MKRLLAVLFIAALLMSFCAASFTQAPVRVSADDPTPTPTATSTPTVPSVVWVDEYVPPTPSCDSWDVQYRIVGGQITMNYSVAGLTPIKKIIPFSAEQGGMTIKFCKTDTNGSRIVVIPQDSWYMGAFTVKNIMTGIDMDLTINMDADSAGILYTDDGVGDVDVSSDSVAGRVPVQIDTVGDGTMDAAGSMLIPMTLVGEFNTTVGQSGELPFGMIFTTGNTTNVVSIPANPKMDGATMVSEGIPFAEAGGAAPYVGTNGTITATGTGDCLGIKIVGIRIDFQFELKLQLEPISPSGFYGDANNDGNLSVMDYSSVRLMLFGKKAFNPGGDANQDGNLSIMDYSSVRLMLFGKKLMVDQYEYSYDFISGADSDRWAKSNSISTLPPALSENFGTVPDDWANASPSDYSNISLTDGNVWTIAGTPGNYSALQCKFTLGESPDLITSIGVTLNGSAGPYSGGGYCAPGCPNSWIGDGYCDSACNNAECSYDGGDCNGGYSSVYGGNTLVYSDSGDEGYCAPGCPNSWLGDGYCDSACNNAACGYDGGDCGVSGLQLWAWNFNTSSWTQIGSTFPMTADIASYTAWTAWGRVYADYIDSYGHMYILATLNDANQNLNVDYIKLSVAW